MSHQDTSNRPIRVRTARDLRNFGWVMAACFSLIAAFLRWKWGAESVVPPCLASLAGIFLILGTVAPTVLGPVEKGWMALAEKISVVMTFVIMVLLFYLVITPLGLLLRLFGKDLLERKIRKDLPSYWTPVEADGPATRPYSPF